MKKKILLYTFAALVLIQFIRIDKQNPIIKHEADFLTITHADTQIAGIIKSSCYDCHSNESLYPWYTNIAPVSWMIKKHINDGRKHLNFSEWGTYTTRRQDHKLKECVEEVGEGEMPLSSYLWIHDEAKLTDAQKNISKDFFNSWRTHESDQQEKKKD